MGKFQNNFWVQKSTDINKIDIYERWNVVITEMKGINERPNAQDLHIRSWAEQNGDDIYLPLNGQKFKSKDIEMTILCQTNQSDIDSFLDYIQSVPFEYSDDYRKKKMTLIYKSHSIKTDLEQTDNFLSYSTIKFTCPSGQIINI